MTSIMYLALIVLLLTSGEANSAQTLPNGCTPIDRAGYVVDRPGAYCVTKNIKTMADFADHPAEIAIVDIRSSNVTIDLMGHTLERSFLSGAGGNGIMIARGLGNDRVENIVLRNGVISGFTRGVYFYASDSSFPTNKRSIEQKADHKFVYTAANLNVENIIFEGCQQDFSINDWVQK